MTRHARAIVLALAVLTAVAARASAQETIEALARQSPQEAAKQLLVMPPAQRSLAIQRLLTNPNDRCQGVALGVIADTFAVQFLPALQQLAKTEKHPRPRERIEKIVETLTLFQPVAVDGLDESAASPETADKRKQEKSLDEIFGVIAVQPRAINMDGAPAPGCEVRAYSDSYGVCVPDGRPRKADKTPDASPRLDLFPGKWTFFAAGGDGDKGMYVCIPSVEVANNKAIPLKASKSLALSFYDCDRRPLDINKVQVIDSAFAGFLDAASLGPSVQGRLQLSTTDRPLDIVAVRQPADGVGYVLHAEKQATQSPFNLSGEKSQCGRLIFKSKGTSSPVKDLEITLGLRAADERDLTIKAQLPLELCVSPGVVDVAYSYLTEGNCRLEFARKPYTMRAGGVQEIVLGGPYECSVFHQCYKEFVKKPNVLVYYLFVRDQNNQCLHACSTMTGKRPERTTIPITVLLKGTPLFDTTRSKPDVQFASEAGSLPSEGDLDALEYRIALPCAAGKGKAVKGHGADLEKTSDHFRFMAPKEFEYAADAWLQGGEAIYKIYGEMLGHFTRGKKDKVEIRFRVKMPPGVGAFAAGGTVNFTVGAGMSVTQPWRILDSPFRHELLHVFGLGHRDFMAITGQEAGVRFCGGSPAARRKRGASQDEILTCLRGKTGPRPDAIVPDILLAQYGHKLFTDYVEKGRPGRDALQAKGLSETEGDCAIFTRLTDGGALDIYKAAGVQMDEAKIKSAANALMGVERSDEPGSQRRETKDARRSLREMEKAFEEKRKAEGLKLVDEVTAAMRDIGDYRQRTWLNCRMAELLYGNDLKKRAYDLLKEGQRTAAQVDLGYLHKIRNQCLKVLRGEPLQAINFF